MTSKLKCPVCQNELRKLFNRYTGEPNCDYECGNFDCELYGIEIPESVWKAIIQKLEDLKTTLSVLERITKNYNARLKASKNGFTINWESSARLYYCEANKALEQIEHKDKK